MGPRKSIILRKEKLEGERRPALLTLGSQFSGSVVSDSLPPHGLQHARPPCPAPTPRTTLGSSSVINRLPQLSLGFPISKRAGQLLQTPAAPGFTSGWKHAGHPRHWWESMPTHPVATSLPAPRSSTLVPTSCRTSPAGPLLQGHRAARAAGRGTDSEAGSCCCAGRGPRDRRSPRCRRRCTPPQGPAPGTAGGTGPPPGGTALLSGTPCRQGTGLHGEDRAGLSRGHARGPRRWEGVSGAGRGSWGLEETGNRAKSAQGTACPGGRGRCQAKVGGEKVSSPRGRLVEAGRRTGRGHSPVQGCVLQSLVWLWGPWHPGSPGAEAEHPRPRVWTPPLHGAEQADQAAH